MRLAPPSQIDWHGAPICSPGLYRVGLQEFCLRNKTRYSYRLFHLTVPTGSPYKQVGNVPRVVPHPVHDPRRKNGNLLAVYPKAVEAPATPPNLPSSLFYHLIPVFVLSLKIPITWGIFKETVKINLAEPILSTNHSPFDFSTSAGIRKTAADRECARELALRKLNCSIKRGHR